MNKIFLEKKSKQKGFTLIEVMITIVIVSIAMLSLAGLLITGVKVNAESETRMDAATLAQSIASRLSVKAVTVGYTQNTAITDAQAMLGGRYDANGQNGGYNPTIVMNPTTTVTGTFVSIIVKLAWDAHGKTKTVQLQSGAVTN